MNRNTQLRWSEVKVGLVVVIALTILVAMIMNLEEGMGLLARQTKFRAVVPHTQGLKVGGPVRLNGVDVGNVHHIAIAENAPRVDITFAVKNSVVPHIREDAMVSIRPMGLLGDKFLEIHPGTPSKPQMVPGGQLVGEAESDFTGIASNATATMENVNTAIREIQRILISISQGQGTASKLITDPSLYDRSKRVIENLERASEKSIALLDKVERGEGTIGRLVSDKEIYNRANHAVRELTELATRLNNQNGTLVKLADPVLYTRLDTLTTRGEQLLNKVENGEGTIGKLVTQDALYTRADKLLTEVEELIADVKKHPTKYFKFSVF
ncbi:MAG: MCE family protein [Nitrospirae bacterium]|nr:MCE family protein [Nitrospirota bacterium]